MNVYCIELCLKMYETSFEKKFIKATEVLYAAEGDRLMQETDVSSLEVHINFLISYLTFHQVFFHILHELTRKYAGSLS